jgi:hypothetical protein
MFMEGLWESMREFSALFCQFVRRFITLDVDMCFDFGNKGGLGTEAKHMNHCLE